MRRFSDLNPLGRGIIAAVAVGTLGIAAGAFLLSYGALYAWIQDTGLYADAGVYATRLERLWPLMLDAAFIIAELAAILGGILRGPRGWPILVMVLTGTLTVVFNVLHAATPAARVAAALPPVLMMACFQIDLAIVGWVMRALGRSDGGVPPGAFLVDPRAQTSWPAYTEDGQTGHGRGSGGEGSKRQTVEAYLARLGPDRAATLTAREISADLAEEGTPVSERYVHDLLGGRSGRNGQRHP
jgi:hypothetical protein